MRVVSGAQCASGVILLAQALLVVQVLPVLKKMRSDYPQIEHWRMRLTLAEKLPQLTPLFEADVVFNELWPLCSFLCNDNVSEVHIYLTCIR